MLWDMHRPSMAPIKKASKVRDATKYKGDKEEDGSYLPSQRFFPINVMHTKMFEKKGFVFTKQGIKGMPPEFKRPNTEWPNVYPCKSTIKPKNEQQNDYFTLNPNYLKD